METTGIEIIGIWEAGIEITIINDSKTETNTTRELPKMSDILFPQYAVLQGIMSNLSYHNLYISRYCIAFEVNMPHQITPIQIQYKNSKW